jgi:hypothetical protein
MNKNKLLSNLLFWLTIISLPIAFSIACRVGEVEIFSVGGIIRYSWIMLLCMPIGILTLLFGLRQRKTEQHYRKLIIVAVICIPLMAIFGSYRFIFREVSFNVSDVHVAEEKIDFELPDNIKVATHGYAGYDASYVKIMGENEANQFVSRIRADGRWMSKLSYELKGYLPFDIQAEMANFDYFMLYDPSSDRYNACPTNDETNCIFIAYDCDLQRIIVLDGI